ncbi:S9 family peptidase [Lutimonas sp.]|uniref:S9 family peptidase n=1 Tax=Lutimonas sp. TaxID=1872403 RepID=UPI003D9B44DC
MRILLLLLFVLVQPLFSQQKEITLEDIWANNTFATESLEAFQSMKNGDYYTILNHNSYGTFMDKYDYKTLEKIETVVVGKDLDGITFFDDYAFSEDEKKLIIGVDLEPIYRRSKIGKYYVYVIAEKSLELIVDKNIQSPTFSPDGKKVAYVFENNLYIKDLASKEIKQVTADGEKNKIINGITDWVYEEEFSFVRAFQWNATSNKIAFIRFDETAVPEFSMDTYGTGLYPGDQTFKYPKAGETNSTVALYIFDLDKDKKFEANIKSYEQYYIPRIQWTKEADVLAVTTINRHQNNLNLVSFNAASNTASLLLNEKDAAYVDINDDLTFLHDNSFIWSSEKDGFNHLYSYDKKGKLQNQITQGPWEVTKYYGFDKKSKKIFYQSTEEGSINRSVYSIDISGKKKKKLSKFVGINSAKFSNSLNYFVNTYSSATTPTVYTLVDAKTGKELKEIKNNLNLAEKLTAYDLPSKEFGTIKTVNGEFNMWMIKPKDFDPNKEYPLLMFQYSGPGSQQVANRWHNAWRHDYWHMMLSQKGYIIVCVDGRGTGFKGRDFKKVTYKELGKYEIEDQIESAKELGKRSYIDKNRIGIWGWSYGGFMSSLAITKGADVFKMAIAVAPVTSWRYYDSVYTERYMQTPQENAAGYDENSPVNFADQLKGDYLLIHGTGDDNVHVQNSMQMINALVEANKQFDYFTYPDRAHGIYRGRNTRLHLFKKMTTFIDRSLGEPQPTEQNIID